MPWPLSQDYNEAIQDPLHNFSDADLKTGEAAANALGIPMPRSGNFADVYEVRCPTGSRWAVKCFTREVFGLSERYAEISKYLRLAHLPFMVDFKYLHEGIRVRGQWYPVLKMQWVEGSLLNEFVRDNLDKKPILQALGQIWLRMAKRLRESYLAHCDLQHGNVLFVPGPTANSLAVKLIDYDGMCVPSLAGTKSGEVGHPAFQHPERLRSGAYNQEVDRFSLLSISTALHCLTVGGRSLWQRYDNGDNLLFRQSDFQAPAQSLLFQELLAISDPQALMLVKELHRACQGRLDAVPLLTDLLPEAQASAAPKSSATMKRTTVVKTATAQASPTADTTATGSAWVFKGEDKTRSRRRRKGGMPRWVVGVCLAGMVLVCAIVAWSIWNESDAPKDTARFDQNRPAEKVSQRRKAVPSAGARPGANQEKQNSESPPSDLTDSAEAQNRGDSPAEPSDRPQTVSASKKLDEGVLPLGADGKVLNLDFETGTLKDWTVEGEAFRDQPIKGDTVAKRRNDMKSRHQGDHWIGGFERFGDMPQGTLTSMPFKVTHPWASFLVGGGPGDTTCVELVRQDTGEVFSRTSGAKEEALRRAIIDLHAYFGKEIFIRLVDRHSGAWGHINFDDFRFHSRNPDDPGISTELSHGTNADTGQPPKKAEDASRIEETPKPETTDDFVSLFNAKDTTGWKSHPDDKGKWEVKDGILIGSGGRGRLLSERGDYKNFRLHVEAMINDGGKSGLFFHSQFSAGAPKGYEVHLNSTHKDPLKTGSLYGIVSVTDQLHKPDEWFTLEVSAEGGHIVIKVNDKQVVDKLDKRYGKGCFALQLHDAATVVKLRKIEVKELPASAESAAGRAPDDHPSSAAEAAVKTYQKSCAAARTRHLTAFDSVIAQLPKRKIPSETRPKLIETVKEEKQRFENSGLIPWSEPMRPHVAGYFTGLAAAQSKLSRFYESLIDAQRRAKNDSKVVELRTELRNRLDIRVLARWQSFVNGGRGGIVTLYSNGRIGNSEANNTWSYADGKLIYRWPNTQAPKGVWIDTLNVSVYGTTYTGTNQLGKIKLSGTYVTNE